MKAKKEDQKANINEFIGNYNYYLKKFNIKKRISKLKNSAKQRKIVINLTEIEYVTAITHGCFYCGKNLNKENGYCLDRMDNKKGYYFENIVPCCKICNIAKNVLGFQEFREWAIRVYTYQKYKTQELEKSINSNEIKLSPEEMMREVKKVIKPIYIKYHPGTIIGKV